MEQPFPAPAALKTRARRARSRPAAPTPSPSPHALSENHTDRAKVRTELIQLRQQNRFALIWGKNDFFSLFCNYHRSSNRIMPGICCSQEQTCRPEDYCTAGASARPDKAGVTGTGQTLLPARPLGARSSHPFHTASPQLKIRQKSLSQPRRRRQAVGAAPR